MQEETQKNPSLDFQYNKSYIIAFVEVLYVQQRKVFFYEYT